MQKTCNLSFFHFNTGGVLHMGCNPWCCILYITIMVAGISTGPRDALLSFKYPPTVYISDIAGRVARHVNNRTQQRFFQPNDGRICAPTDTNISLAAAGKLTVNLSGWRKSGGNQGMQKNSKKWTNCHVHTLRQGHQIGSHCTTDFTKKN